MSLNKIWFNICVIFDEIFGSKNKAHIATIYGDWNSDLRDCINAINEYQKRLQVPQSDNVNLVGALPNISGNMKEIVLEMTNLKSDEKYRKLSTLNKADFNNHLNSYAEVMEIFNDIFTLTCTPNPEKHIELILKLSERGKVILKKCKYEINSEIKDYNETKKQEKYDTIKKIESKYK